MRTRRSVGVGALALAVAVSLGIGGCSGAPAGPDEPTTLRIGIESLPGNFSPATLGAFLPPAQPVYETLFTSMLEFGEHAPGLATGYERSDDWKTVTLTLRDDVTFVDGEKFTAAGLKTYLEGMATHDDWWIKSYWDAAAPTLTAVDETTLTISSETALSVNYRTFLGFLFLDAVIASPSVLDDFEGAATEPVGSGPYVLDTYTPEIGVSFVRNEEYRNPEAYPFDRIEYTVFADQIAALNALRAGQIDATKISTSLAEEADGAGFSISRPDLGGRSMMLYVADRNGTQNPAVGDVRVRQAMALAFDREAINESINHGYGRVSSQPFVETQPEYVADGDDRYAYDPDRARELMAEAGYADGFDLVLPSTSFFGINTWNPIVEQYLGDIGIRVTFDDLPTDRFFDAVVNSTQYPVMMYYEGFYQILPVFITGDAVFNLGFKVQDPVVDELWAAAQAGPQEAADEARAELGEYVVDQSLIITFAIPDDLWASVPEVSISSDEGAPRIVQFQLAGSN
jgi:peptide/nickel transport system substrate-binding protein